MFPSNIKNNILPLILLTFIILGVFIIYWPYVSIIILAGTLAVVLYSPYQRLCKYVSEKRAATIVIVTAIIILTVIITFILSVLINSSSYLFDMSETIADWLNTLPHIGFLRGSIFGSSLSVITGLIKNAVIQAASSLPSFAVQFLFFLLSLFLFLLRGRELVDDFFSAIPDHLQAVTTQLKKDIVNTLYATYVVNLQICVITFIIAIPFFTLLGVKGGIVANATLASVSQLIPTIGPLLVLVFITLYALALGNIPLAIVFIILGYVLFMFIPGSVLKPKMMGKRVSLPAPMMMIAIIGAIATIGIAGIILGPLFATLLVSGYRLLIAQVKLMRGDIPNTSTIES